MEKRTEISKTMCENCGRSFPDHLISALIHNTDSKFLCPICALSLRNQIHSLPEGTPFWGSVAQETYEEAIDYLKLSEEKAE